MKRIKINNKYVKLPDPQLGPCDGCGKRGEVYKTFGLNPKVPSDFLCLKCLKPILSVIPTFIELRNCYVCQSLLLNEPYYESDSSREDKCLMCELLEDQGNYSPLKGKKGENGAN